MRKTLFICLSLIALQTQADKYLTKTGKVIFTSKAPLETIEGTNKSVATLLNTDNGSVEFSIQIKSFVFDRQLLQEHFNENYMESDKIPKATFKGSITNKAAINFAKDGEYKAEVSGKMTIHGVEKDVKNVGKIIIKGNTVQIISDFSILLADYNIAIPGAVKDKISKDVKVSVNCALEKMK
ncbi:MAG: YceI family protein [Bacteroidetes bacterium]|nr:YceI family protein [Bacteroidota bacterium]